MEGICMASATTETQEKLRQHENIITLHMGGGDKKNASARTDLELWGQILAMFVNKRPLFINIEFTLLYCT